MFDLIALHWNQFAHFIAHVAALPINPQIFIGLRVLVFLACCIVASAQLRSWQGHMNTDRWSTSLSWFAAGVGFAMSAILTAQGGDNVKLYQLVVALALLWRLLIDGKNAGRRRCEARKEKNDRL